MIHSATPRFEMNDFSPSAFDAQRVLHPLVVCAVSSNLACCLHVSPVTCDLQMRTPTSIEFTCLASSIEKTRSW